MIQDARESAYQVWSHNGLHSNCLSGTLVLGTALFPKFIDMVEGTIIARFGYS